MLQLLSACESQAFGAFGAGIDAGFRGQKPAWIYFSEEGFP